MIALKILLRVLYLIMVISGIAIYGLLCLVSLIFMLLEYIITEDTHRTAIIIFEIIPNMVKKVTDFIEY